MALPRGGRAGVSARLSWKFYGLIRKLSRALPSASAATIQRGALPRPVQVSPVSGCRYLAGTTRFAVVPDVAGDLRAVGRVAFLLYAAVISSGVMSYSRMERIIDALTVPRRLVFKVCASFFCFSFSFSFFFLIS